MGVFFPISISFGVPADVSTSQENINCWLTKLDTSIDKEYIMFLLFLFYYARQAHNFKNQMFFTSKLKPVSMVKGKNITPK